VKNLSPDEQAEFRIYRKVMTAPQIRTYLSQTNAAERTAYLEQLGLVQRFNALDPQDRHAVEAGYIRKGISADGRCLRRVDMVLSTSVSGPHYHQCDQVTS
jgi:hypothetical protein